MNPERPVLDRDGVHEFPFLFPGMPARYQGREEVRAGYRAAWGASPAQPQEIRDVVTVS